MRAGALLRYKSPSTQLEPVKGCAHPAESAGLGGQPAPQGGGGEHWRVHMCVPDYAKVFMCPCVCVCWSVRVYLFVPDCSVIAWGK